MKNFRLVTPILVTITLAILSYLVFEMRATRCYADMIMDKHEERPHMVTETKMDELTKQINDLTIEVRLLRYEIKNRSEGD